MRKYARRKINDLRWWLIPNEFLVEFYGLASLAGALEERLDAQERCIDDAVAVIRELYHGEGVPK